MHLAHAFRQYRFLLLATLSCLSGACNTEPKQAKNYERVPASLATKPKLVHKPTGPDKAVHDLLTVNGDTLIAVKWHGGLALTTDAGSHWKKLHDQSQKRDFLYIKYLTIDEHHVLWGLDSWKGIHEADYSRLFYSTDFGKTWKHHEFDTHIFFPYNFYSLPGKPLQVVAFDGTVYQIQDRTGAKWKPLKNVAELNNSVNDTIPGNSYFSGGRFKFLETGQLFDRKNAGWKTIVKVGFINEVSDVCSCAGSIYLAGSNNSTSPTPEYLLHVKRGQVIDTMILPSGTQYTEEKNLLCDNKGRLWLYNFRGIWQKSGDKLLKRY